MEILDSEQHQKEQKKHSPLILVLSILTIIGSVIQGLYVWLQISTASIFIKMNETWTENMGENPFNEQGNGFSSLVKVYKFRLIGDYVWAGAILASIIAAILFLSKRKLGIVFYSVGAVAFIVSSILFFLVLGDMSKAFGGNMNPLSNIIEIVCIVCSLLFLFLYSMNYKKHCK